MADWRLAVDIGGTFTDVVLLDAESGRVVVDKTLTTPSAPLDGVRTGVTQLLAKAGVSPAEITKPIVHATTLITNALIEGKTGRAGLVTTQGFGDTLLILGHHYQTDEVIQHADFTGDSLKLSQLAAEAVRERGAQHSDTPPTLNGR